MKTWVDASYAVYNNMKSHTGGVVSFGRGVTMSKSSKQKLNTKSSTEAELVRECVSYTSEYRRTGGHYQEDDGSTETYPRRS